MGRPGEARGAGAGLTYGPLAPLGREAGLRAWWEAAIAQAEVPGETDCTLTAADCAWRMTGRDPALAYRGRYPTVRQARRAIRDAGGLPVLIARVLGAPLPRPSFAQRGDVVVFVEHEKWRNRSRPVPVERAGVAVGHARVFARGARGLVTRPSSVVTLAWPVMHAEERRAELEARGVAPDERAAALLALLAVRGP